MAAPFPCLSTSILGAPFERRKVVVTLASSCVSIFPCLLITAFWRVAGCSIITCVIARNFHWLT